MTMLLIKDYNKLTKLTVITVRLLIITCIGTCYYYLVSRNVLLYVMALNFQAV